MRRNGWLTLVAVLSGCATAGETGGRDGAIIDAPSSDVALPIDAPVDGPPDACIVTTEICNDHDDDCDGSADEDFAQKNMPCSAGSGACHTTGMYVCSASGSDTECNAVAGTPTTETCDHIDNDCDGSTDETFLVGQTCSVGLGACVRSGQYICNTAGTGTDCNATPGAPAPELCGNAIDEDCNGADAACPPNDLPAGAIDISAGGTFTADLTAAHDDNWAASTPTLDCGDPGGRDVFYKFTLPAEEVVYFDTFGSNFDSVIRVFAGSCTAIGATEACADDACVLTQSQGAVDLLAGTYCLVVDQFNGATTAGAMQLVFKRGGRSGIGIAAVTGTQTGSTTGKTNYSIAGCESNSAQPDVGYFFLTCPNRTYTVGANTCSGTSFDTVIYLRSGNATTGDVACSDDVSGCGNGLQSHFTGASVGGANLQWLIVDGFGQTGNGPYALGYSIQ